MPPYFSFACYTFDDEKISTLHFNPTDIALYGGIVLEWCSGSHETQPPAEIIFSPPHYTHYPLPTTHYPAPQELILAQTLAVLCVAQSCCCVLGLLWVETGALKPPVAGAGPHCPNLLQLVAGDGDTAAAQWSWCFGDDGAENVAD